MDMEDFKTTKESSQDFPLAPPNTSDSVGGAEANFQESCQLTPTTDWSRKSRNLLSSLKIAADPVQTKITDYFKLIDHLQVIIQNLTLCYRKYAKFNSDNILIITLKQT